MNIKETLSRINNFFRQNNLKSLFVIHFSVSHCPEVEFLLTAENSSLKITANFCKEYHGNLKEWSVSDLQLTYETFIVPWKRNIEMPVFCLKDEHTGFYVKSTNIYFKETKLISQTIPDLFDLSKVQNKDLNINELNCLLGKYKNIAICPYSVDNGKFVFHLKSRKIINYLTEQTEKTDDILIVECIRPTFYSAWIIEAWESSFFVKREKNAYAFVNHNESFKIVCSSIAIYETQA